ncbi:MAG: hypothetical protein QHJ34_02250 [bacterium]|nr:hypothetical protein [candidate division KSB1 bacterium]MDH7559040.1 hypothetical protein [bacterium]
MAPLGGPAASRVDASCIGWNPAGLSALNRRSVVLDWVPGLVQNAQSLLDLSGTLNEQLDAVIDDYGAPSAAVHYPELAANVGFHPLVSGFAVGLPFQVSGRKVGVGLGYRQPFAMSGALLGSGFEVALDSEQEVQGERRRIRMRTWLDVNADLEIKAHELYVGLGAQLGRATSIGVALRRLVLRGRCNAYAAVEGIVEMSGGEYAFNDPYDPRIDFARGEQNRLHQSFFAEYAGEAWGVRLGVLHRLGEHLHVGAAASLPARLRLGGRDSTVNNRIPFIRVEEGAGGDVEDLIDATKIDLAKLTLTERLASHNVFMPELRLPGSLQLGILWESATVALSAHLALYAGQFSLALQRREARGLRLRYGGGLGLDLRYFFVGLSSDLGDEVRPRGNGGTPLRNVPLPRINLGGRVPMASGLWLTGLVGVEPTPLLRLSAQYEF